jgi:uncharacterized DUF497 family protein
LQEFEWDPKKDRINERRHGISFETAEAVFDDPYLLLEEDRDDDGESRLWAIGFAGNLAVLVVVHTVRYEGSQETIIRIISARKADREERRRYGAALSRSV